MLSDTKLDHLAIHGGKPVRSNLLPYGRQWIDEEDIQAVTRVLQSDLLTTGPKVKAFEDAFSKVAAVAQCIAVSSGTAALHAAMHAIGIGRGDEVIVPPITFAATANVIVYQGGKPVFADVCPDNLLLDPASVEAHITPHTKAIIAVDYAGQPCDYAALRSIADKHHLYLIADATHSLGAFDEHERPVGSLADISAFSFHPVKPIATGEGGMAATSNQSFSNAMRLFRNHGIDSDHKNRAENKTFHYEMVSIGYNYRLSDFQCALGIEQLKKLPAWTARRQTIAARYDMAFSSLDTLKPLRVREGVSSAYHLYVVQLNLKRLTADRNKIFEALRAEGIGANVHFIPVHFHPFYRDHFKTGPGLCPVAEEAYERILTLPIFPAMTEQDINDVIDAVNKVVFAYRQA